jgi:WD40 repeat protein
VKKYRIFLARTLVVCGRFIFFAATHRERAGFARKNEKHNRTATKNKILIHKKWEQTNTPTMPSPTPPKILHLGLDEEDEDQPRRLLLLPSGEILAYGGDDGLITLFHSETNDSNKKQRRPKVMKRFDDAMVRAMACSKDGKRVVAGFSDGSTMIYSYEDYNKDDSSSPPSHPFCAAGAKGTKDDNDDDDALYSQDLGVGEDDDDDTNRFPGPSSEGPVRDLQFHPTSTNYLLAIASEHSMCVVQATSSKTIREGRYLEKEVNLKHDGCGIRGLEFSPSGALLATLDLEGRLCLWTTTTADDPATWKFLKREAHACVTRKDFGEMRDETDPYDRSCRPLLTNDWVATPGKVQLTLRRIQQQTQAQEDESVTVSDPLESKDDDDNDGKDAVDGHIESIVAMSVHDEDPTKIITSGRDGRVLVWNLPKSGQAAKDLVLFQTLGHLESPPTHLLVHNQVLYAALANGSCAVFSLGKEDNSAAKKKTKPKETSAAAVTFTEPQPPQDQHKRLSKPKNHTKEDTFAADSDDDDVDFGGSTAAQEGAAPSRFVDDEADEDDDDDDAVKVLMDGETPTKSAPAATQGRADHDSDDDSDDDSAAFENLRNSHAPSSRFATVPAVKSQPAFCPSSTPLDLTRRFLCWNNVGSITLLRGDDVLNNRNTVDITFTDSGMRRPISFTDNINFIVGSLGEDGGIFASDLQEDDAEDDNDVDDIVGDLYMSERTKAAVKKSHKKRMAKDESAKPTGSSIYFHRFETFGNLRDKDWYLTLPGGERVMGAATGEGWAAVVTR